MYQKLNEDYAAYIKEFSEENKITIQQFDKTKEKENFDSLYLAFAKIYYALYPQENGQHVEIDLPYLNQLKEDYAEQKRQLEDELNKMAEEPDQQGIKKKRKKKKKNKSNTQTDSMGE